MRFEKFLGVGWVSCVLFFGCGDPPIATDSGVDAFVPSDTRATCPACTDPSRPHCDPETNTCVACVEASQCTAEPGAVCLSGVCRPCVTNTQCMAQRALPFCRADGACVACTAPTDCPAETPYCSAEGTCAECRSESDCSDQAPLCAEGSCQSCARGGCSPAQEVRELYAAQCEGATRQEGSSSLADAFEGLLCSTQADLFPLFGVLESAVTAGRVSIDESGFDACRAAMTDSACADLLRGNVTLGGTCTASFECESGRCQGVSGTCAGTCVARSGAGLSCADDSECTAGLTCIGSVCQAAPVVGAPCTSRCADGLFCNTSMRCEAARDVGTSCSGVGMIAACRQGLSCEAGVCSAAPSEGQACWPDYYGTRCATGFRCVGSTCRAPSALGASCVETTECPLGARCQMGNCTSVTSLGAPCTAASACAFGTACSDGRCRPLPDVGEPCFSAGCLRGVCRMGTCQAQGLLTSCPAASYPFDLFDPCGAMSSCTETPGSWLCAAEGGPGATCGSAENPECRQPDLYCSDTGTCVSACAL